MYPARRAAMPDTIFNFFGLRENPFRINPDPRFLFVTDEGKATSDVLSYAIRSRKGLILLTGEVGTGKTMLIRQLLNWLAGQNMPTALIFNSHIKAEHLLDFILNDFGVPCASTLKSEKLIALNRWLLEQYRIGQIPVLIVDEAQGLDSTALEEVRLLLNFETPREKLLQIVLAGQPELEIKLKSHQLRQLRQRITIRCRTKSLTLEQTHGYIRERLRVAGANGMHIFEPDAVASVHAFSHGIPRVINVLCEHSLVNACADGCGTVSPGAVEQAARDCQLDRAESVARILNTGSYSTTRLSDIGSMLAAISAGSDSPTEPRRVASTPGPARTPPRRQPAPAAPTQSGAAAHTPLENHWPQDEVAPAFANVGQTQPAIAEPATTAAGPIAHSETAVPEIDAPAISVAGPGAHSARRANTLRLWSQSFAADARATWRQLRRALRSFEIHKWNPFVRHLERELHQLHVRARQFVADPRWKHLSATHNAWNGLKAGMPHWLAEPLGIRRQSPQARAQNADASRRRAVMYLRRWLHQPLSTQRKRSHTSTRRF